MRAAAWLQGTMLPGGGSAKLGVGRGQLRGPSPETAAGWGPCAEAWSGIGRLCSGDFQRHPMVTEHRKEQARQLVEVARPSITFSEVPRAEGREQVAD
ncbi:hypothetical protein A8M32_25815 [Sinorhizobium alkalisoli]|uniref:Uncharacterized protein n=1 Tax=Sinorhizobium alkalisoli TaxID=1752398 RepID=A0A1E3V5K4_9HYPH|nr:hypothetical protein A8M32_25815 [Sinorhizobium alkalisoli]